MTAQLLVIHVVIVNDDVHGAVTVKQPPSQLT